MIFGVSPSQIEKLNSEQLVELLKKLLHAEAQRSGISLRGVSVPLQITVPDGGEDARISWTGGFEQTDYLPSRFCIFQAKATDPKPAGWKKEVWTKDSWKKGNKPKLNEAVEKAITENGSYIGFTTAVLISSKYDDRINGIQQGIREAGADPNQLKAIEIYDANKISHWVSLYPAIAVWLNEKQSGLSLQGFQTVETWGRKAEIISISRVEDKASRFFIGSESITDNSLTFDKVKERIADFLADSQKSIRVIGSSGVGKTRLVYEVVRDEATTGKIALRTSTIYCDFRDIGSQIFQIAQSIAESKNSALMIVDECPRDTAAKLCEIVTSQGSNLKVITIGNDTQRIEKDNCLNISVTPADDDLIEGIIRQRYPYADYSDVNFIQKISAGYPRIAVLATNNYSEGLPILKSIEDVVERILTGCGINRPEQIRAIECLALFKQLGADENISDEIDFVAENLARQTGDEMYEHLAYAAKQNLLDYRNYYFALQLQPIVAFLGTRRLDFLRAKTIINFIENAPPTLRTSFLSQWRYFDSSKTAFTVAQRLLAIDNWCGSLEKLKTDIGSQCLNAIVHIDPDGVANVIDKIYRNLSIDDLQKAVTREQDFVQVLAILVSRKRYFYTVAPLLMRLAVVENNAQFKNATNRFKQLFQLRLSETEVEPYDRFLVLEQGILSGNERIISICIEALENTLKINYWTGLGIFGDIGIQSPLKEWIPKVQEEVFEFHRNGIKKLNYIRSQHQKFAIRCENIIAKAIRSLLWENLFNDLEGILHKITKEKEIWLEGIKGVGDWLYFDSTKASEEFSQKVRNLYEQLLPTNPIQKALLYTKFWHSHIRNPDIKYEPGNNSTHDFEYSARKARETAAEIAVDKELTKRAIQTMIKEELNNIFPFTHELAMKLEDPVESFQFAVNEFEVSPEKKGFNFIRGLLSGIDLKDPNAANECIAIALKSNSLKHEKVNIYRSVGISVKRLDEIVQSVREKSISATDCRFFSYGQGLNRLNPEDIIPLIDELTNNHGAEGLWSSLEIISMYQANRDKLNIEIAKRIKEVIDSQELITHTIAMTQDGFLLEQIILLIQQHYGIEDDFAISIINQIINICKTCDYRIVDSLDNNLRTIICLLVKEKPLILWQKISQFFEIATPMEMYCLEAFIGTPRHSVDEEIHNKQGSLFGVPHDECVKWAKINPKIRASFLCVFYPLLEKDEAGNYRWHLAMQNLTYEFGAYAEFRVALENRFCPKMWFGSIIPYLEAYLVPLQTWFQHQIPEISVWAREVYTSLERQITTECNIEE
ncbi:hypothetical protein [Nostoc sp. FACHB-280]|uniref:hypothetical protein n=1 Tax=Nostoc sp. FACHB-280 TaxID=2692839 RepID=UPI00168A8BE0|nr:hypothetical protein [Nostoc sp. FACHB-280]MBD2498921.1 hypothetical protein [Nostoc sp. FACHB-280]